MKLSILKPGGEIPLIEQKSDNTNIRKPKIVEKKPYNWGNCFSRQGWRLVIKYTGTSVQR